MPNDDEIAYWDGSAGALWSRFQERLDRTFEPFECAVLSRAKPRDGEAIVDVGCGCGASSVAVGSSGRVAGIDVSHEMLAVARARANELGLTNVRFMRADASNEMLEPESFDLLFSRFGVMFFDDPGRAFTHLRASLRTSGRIAFVCWRDLKSNPWFAEPYRAVRDFAPPQPKADPLAPGPMAFADRDRLYGILDGAKFRNISIEPFDAPVMLGTRAEATEMISRIGPAARMLDLTPAETKPEALDSLDRMFAENERDGKVELTGAVWLVSADR